MIPLAVSANISENWPVIPNGRRRTCLTREKLARWWHFTLRPVGKFLHFYLLRGGIRDGRAGLIVCVIGAISVAMKYINLAEMNHEAKKN